MPDWFYRTVARPALFALPDRAARTLALGMIGTLGRNAGGRAVIDFLGHMGPDPRLRVTFGGVEFPSPVGLGWSVDPERRATLGLARFGAGFMEERAVGEGTVRRCVGEGLLLGVTPPSTTFANGTRPLPVLRRMTTQEGERLCLPDGQMLPVVSWREEPPSHFSSAGVVLQVGELGDSGWRVPAMPPAGLAAAVRSWRQALPGGAPLIVAGGVADPGDALELIEAGATLLVVDAGLVYRGPGLIKRCNEALASRLPAVTVVPGENVFRRAWLWSVLLGGALFVGGVATLLLAAGPVLLPYDEHYLGLTSETLKRNSPLLFAFMAHDRATLAGTMLGLGWMYLWLGAQGVMRGVHGAKTAVAASALTGFASFFGFFGFGYFDTLHAFVAAMLFQLTVQVLVGSEGGGAPRSMLVDREDAAWRRAQWAQLCWVVHSAGLLFAGALILGIGMTKVFVAEDLNFLCLTAEQATQLGERLFGVVAHDRATLGGMLLSAGVATLLPVLWCFRRGARWLWTALAGLGVPAYAAAFGAHFATGYLDLRHLLPAAVGLALWASGLGLGWRYLRGKD